MKIISHRGNIRGSIPEKENRPSYIDCAIGSGHEVEIDVRYSNGSLWLGHDEPQYKIDHVWIEERKKYLLIHCKNLRSAIECRQYQSFCHTQDDYSYTTSGKIWLHDLHQTIDDNVIIPLMDKPSINAFKSQTNNIPFGICTDYPSLLVNFYD